MNHTSASISINNSIEKHDLSILIVMLVLRICIAVVE